MTSDAFVERRYPSAYREGRQARDAGKPVKAVPYPADEAGRADAWRKGWAFQDAQHGRQVEYAREAKRR